MVFITWGIAKSYDEKFYVFKTYISKSYDVIGRPFCHSNFEKYEFFLTFDICDYELYFNNLFLYHHKWWTLSNVHPSKKTRTRRPSISFLIYFVQSFFKSYSRAMNHNMLRGIQTTRGAQVLSHFFYSIWCYMSLEYLLSLQGYFELICRSWLVKDLFHPKYIKWQKMISKYGFLLKLWRHNINF